MTQAENTRRGNARRYANGGYAQPCSIPRAKTRPRSEELKVLGDTLASFKAEKLLTIAEIGAVMGRSVQMVRLYFIGESEPGVFAWRRAVAKWPELNDRLIFNLDEAEKAFCARQRTFNLRIPEERVA